MSSDEMLVRVTGVLRDEWKDAVVLSAEAGCCVDTVHDVMAQVRADKRIVSLESGGQKSQYREGQVVKALRGWR